MQPWYQGGYRANIVAYAIAKTAYDIKERRCSVDFPKIWRRQALGASMEEGAWPWLQKQVHHVLISPRQGISNVTEWAKKEFMLGSRTGA